MPTKTDSVALEGYRRLEWQYPGGPINRSEMTPPPQSDVWTITKTGNWDRPKPAILKPSPYSVSVSTARFPRGEIQGTTPYGDWRRYSGTFTGGAPHTWRAPDERVRLKNEALLDMLSSVKDQSWNAGVALAEAKGTAQLAMDAGELLAKTFRSLRKHDFRSAYEYFRRTARSSFSWEEVKRKYGDSLSNAERGRKIPNSWTYYHFGIKPTIQDIENVQKDWYRRNIPGGVPAQDRFSGQVRGKARFPVRREGYGPFDIFNRTYIRYSDIQSVRVTCGVRVKNEFLAKLAQLGATNVPEAVWNGIPFSWVVDYFASFGDWVGALDSNVGWEYFDLCESYRRVITEKADWFENPSNPSVPRGLMTVERPYTKRTKELVRTVPVLLYPPIYRTLPMWSLKGPSAQQFSMLGSVLSGLLSGRRASDVVRY